MQDTGKKQLKTRGFLYTADGPFNLPVVTAEATYAFAQTYCPASYGEMCCFF